MRGGSGHPPLPHLLQLLACPSSLAYGPISLLCYLFFVVFTHPFILFGSQSYRDGEIFHLLAHIPLEMASAAFPDKKHLGHELMSVWDAGTTGALACSATVPAPLRPLFLPRLL